jgi:hypothetical protein
VKAPPVVPDLASSRRFVVDSLPIYSIRGINELDAEIREAIYRTLVPDDLLLQCNVDPQTLCDPAGHRLVEFTSVTGTSSFEVKLWHQVGAQDPLLYLQMADTANNQLSVLFFVVNDPNAPRFDVDKYWEGELAGLGPEKRNVEAETAAMKAGLAPYQTRRGLRLTRKLVPSFELFVSRLGHQIFVMEPLGYHTAILFERYGCAYSQGRAKMEWINREFRPGGTLYHRLDNSTPFRRPGMESTIRGRSWAVYDGILGERFTDVRMYRRVGASTSIGTCPDAEW